MSATSPEPRINVGVRRQTHTSLLHTARFLEKDVQDAVDEAVRDWVAKNAAKAKKKAREVFGPA